METESSTPPSASSTLPSAATPRRRFPAILGVGALAAVLIVAGLGAYILVRGAADQVGAAVPANSTFYLSESLAPGQTQLSAANSLIDKFPAANNEDLNTLINQGLDSALKSKNLSHTDVRSWLGTQLGLVGGSDLAVTAGGTKNADVAFIAQSTDDSAATAFLSKLRAAGHSHTWSTTSHDGVTVNQGAPAGGTDGQTVDYAVFNHLVVVATTSAEINQIIDTAHGNSPSLTADSNYKSAFSTLPSDNLGSFYLNIHALFSALKSAPGASSLPSSALQSAEAYRSAVAVLTAQGNGFKVQGTETFDPSKLSAAAREAAQAAPHLNTALGFVPAHAFGFLAMEGFDKILTNLLDTFSSLMPTGSLNSLGITGSHGIAQKLTGDFGFEVDQATAPSFPVDGAFLLGTTDSSAMQQFLTQKAEEIITSAASSTQKVTESNTTYKGATVTSVDTNTAGTLEASFTVYKGMAIVGGSVAEVEHVMDTRDSGEDVTTTAGYADAIPAAQRSANGEFYVDLRAVSAAVRKELPRKDAAVFDLFVAPITDHFTEISVTSQSASDHSDVTLFVGIH